MPSSSTSFSSPGRSWGVVLRHGEAHADLQAEVAAEADAVQRFLEGALHAAELVVRLANAVEADADVVKVSLRDTADVGFVDQRAVGGETDVEAQALGPLRDVEDVRPQQRLAAGENQHRHAEALEVVHHGIDLLRAQFAGEVLVGGDRVAVLAGEVAAADQVPDDDRPRRIALLAQRRGMGDFFHVPRDSEHS